MINSNSHIVLCGGVSPSPHKTKKYASNHIHRLIIDPSNPGHNINLELPHFIQLVNCHFPDRIKDLLEIAGYVYAADRMIGRGANNSLEYHSWSRQLNFIIRVRDVSFWSNPEITKRLSDALTFVSGDQGYSFIFKDGGADIGQKSLYDHEAIQLQKRENSIIGLFSGGLDSLAGALEILTTTDKNLILVSHRSNTTGVSKIQKGIHRLLETDFPGRIQYFAFYCNLHGERAVEETQRTRIFLYTAIAYSLSTLASEKEIHVFENGVTSLNFSKRADLVNARASRTTHPQTLKLLENFYSAVGEEQRPIVHPFLYNTKTDIFNKIKAAGKVNYINSTISCTKTFLSFENNSQATHCGGCSQCVDRRLAAFASDLQDFDAIYDIDIAKDPITSPESRTHLNDYIRAIVKYNNFTEMNFQYEMLAALTDIIPYLEGQRPSEKAMRIYDLLKTHTSQVLNAIRNIQLLQDPLKPKIANTLNAYIDERMHLKPPIECLIETIKAKLTIAIPQAFEHEKPKHENALNDVIHALIQGESIDYGREYPTIKFSIARVIPDHSFLEIYDLLIEAKYLRGNTSKAAITDQIGADITKYPKEKYKLFIIYDPERKIANDVNFSKDIEKQPNCKVFIIR
ncbi:PD-(D/E)XK nuclease domain-containing protein [Pedobacter africanus]|uniref:Queuosine biosynthesis protein QueC n=1 Tax=Pedobacter africanus TaxID=151894 RepID=A0A1W2B6F4_9SPHI|nr:7-cyano-7-deazaguanine synthase [Pedobacter africanus]SMC67938.1 Queuosine biosynthesis protein QueC [Pedobacter africanus]